MLVACGSLTVPRFGESGVGETGVVTVASVGGGSALRPLVRFDAPDELSGGGSGDVDVNGGGNDDDDGGIVPTALSGGGSVIVVALSGGGIALVVSGAGSESNTGGGKANESNSAARQRDKK